MNGGGRGRGGGEVGKEYFIKMAVIEDTSLKWL